MKPKFLSFCTFAFCCLFLNAQASAIDISVSLKQPAEVEAVVQQEEARAKAPLGLQWGMLKTELEMRGIRLKKVENKPTGRTYQIIGLKKLPLKIQGIYLTFSLDDRLWRVSMVSRYFNDDPDGRELLKTYSLLQKRLSRQYGEGVKTATDEKDRERGQGVFAKNLLLGKTVRYVDFDNGDVAVRLRIGARDFDSGYYVMAYRFKPLAKNEKENNM